ncbi:MAG: glutamine-hydrolyzing carbamoyl-phosphate synthase small subunit [Deltaproteobacteria bacterium]|nr:glutamine-hydrolyzing carbamoyl-phosphate synthase small subunit [Deltaproteobacteria bacterium]MCW5807162.1 glutamine-hydrolyzing carbamoyl-phosphate synthase small subunit [Deltaproteobacteria bacterium]
MTTSRWPAALVLENGNVYRGEGFGARVESLGEVVFNTSMTGYQEIISDPSYCGQIVVMTATQIGNVGVNRDDLEARRCACAGFAIRELSPIPASWRSTGTLSAWLEECGIPGIDGIDTRALTRALRDGGAMRGGITPNVSEIPAVLERVRSSPVMDGLDLVPRVTARERYEWTAPTWRAADDGRAVPPPPIEHHVVAYDFGIKENILRQLRDLGCRVTVVPATTPAHEALALAPDGIFLSNGPGDPAAVTYAVAATRELCDAGLPVFGICLGHQILGLALGATTRKLPFGHHGGNHPVIDKTTGKVEITSQNHGFVVDPATLPSGVHVTHENLFDHSNEGIAVEGKPIFSVQYHPEASPGPHDASYLFARFRDHLRRHKRA